MLNAFRIGITSLLFSLSWVSFCQGPVSHAVELAAGGMAISVKSSPSAVFTTTSTVPNERKLVRDLLKSEVIVREGQPELPRASIVVKSGKLTAEFILDYPGQLYGLQDHHWHQLREPAQTKLLRYVQDAEKKHFGERVQWEQVDELWPRMADAQVTDLDTGLTFQVQRRAGSKHADAQPLSKQDTAIMKEIYHGKWSWNRRAILVKVASRSIAASMNGMPHGAGAIPDNRFPGHFCIHFEGSTTHRRNHGDPGHDLMIQKSAGDLYSRIAHANPTELVHLFLTAFKEQDYAILRLTLNQSDLDSVDRLIAHAQKIEEIRIVPSNQQQENGLQNSGQASYAEVPIRLILYSSGRMYTREIRFQAAKAPGQDRWKIDPKPCETVLNEIAPGPHPSAVSTVKQMLPGKTVVLQLDPKRNQLYVLVDGAVFKKYPIALGKPETPTPVGQWHVINKYKNWGDGFGTRWIGLNVPWGIYGIHGTNRPFSIGHDASHGCVRMHNRDVEELYQWVKVGTPVYILGHPLGEPTMDPRRLAEGDRGVDVKVIQNRLRGAGFYAGDCDGRFGVSTQLALKAFEKAHGLPSDGVISWQDYVALGLVE
ncbi:MAG: hypothetical protein JWN30_1785 [Bacilli bacterium]|nr:hypothetical protein [Bacilli bacterium]